MKKIFCFLAAMPFLASCILDYSDIRPVDPYILQQYADARRYEIIDIPLALLQTSIEFDAYVSTPEAERPSGSKFFGNYKSKGDDVYEISVFDKKNSTYLSMELYTGGKSIWDENAIWLVNKYQYDGRYLGEVPEEDTDIMEDGSELAMISVSDSIWTFRIGDYAAVKMKMHPVKDGLYTWTVEAQGTSRGENEMTAEYGTVGFFVVREGYPYGSQDASNFYEGQFNASIFKSGEPYDYCYVTYKYDQQPVYKTSR